MIEHFRRSGARRARRALVGALAVGAVLVVAPSAQAVEDVTTRRLAGTDRFATAAAVAEDAYPAGTDTVILASGRAFPDALAGAALAGDLDAPVLLTEPDRLPAATSTAIDELGADTVFLLGGTAAVSKGVEDALVADGLDVTRLAGTDRYGTAAEIAAAIGSAAVSDLDDLPTAIVATGRNFADALAGGPLAGAGAETGVHPILLVDSGVPQATEDAIADLGIEQVVILGGTAAVPQSVENELEQLTGNDAVRLAGTDRYATAVDVADAAVDSFGFTTEEVLLANGVVFADALAGGPLGALLGAPILLTPATQLAVPTRDFLELNSATVETITILGGTAAVATAVEEAAEEAAESPPQAGANETVEVGPRSSAHLANGSTREFTVSGLDATPVDIVLVRCSSVSTSGANTVLANANTNGIADGTAQSGSAPDLAAVENVRISSVNGTDRATSGPTAPPNDDYVNNATPDEDGTVTFAVASSAGTPLSPNNTTVCVVPVVFEDANVDNALNGSAANPTSPTEAFGVGGPTTFSPEPAAAGQFASHEVASVDKASDRFTACAVNQLGVADPTACKTFVYDAADNFQIDSDTVTFAVWEAALSTGDRVRGTYQPSGISTFNLDDRDQPTGEPTITSAQGSSANGVADADDVHQLVFSEAIATAASAITYQVTDGDGTVATISCGGMSANALCTFNSARTTLRARLTGTPSTSTGGGTGGLQYPLTVSATNAEDDDENGVDLGGSADRTIEQASLTGDVAGPVITAATLETDTDPVNFNSVGDVMHLTFDDTVAIADADGELSETQLEAVLGHDVTYGLQTVVTAAKVNANTVSLTVSGGDFFPTGGVQAGAELPGTGNTTIVDDANNPQAAATTPATLQAAE